MGQVARGVEDDPGGQWQQWLQLGLCSQQPEPYESVDQEWQHHAEGESQPELQGDLPEGRLCVTAGRSGSGNEDEYHRQGQPVVDAALHVQQLPELGRYFLTAHDRRGEHRVCRGEDGAHEEGGRPVQTDQVVGDQRHTDEVQGHAEAKGAGGVLPVLLELREGHVHAVGEQHREQRQIGGDHTPCHHAGELRSPRPAPDGAPLTGPPPPHRPHPLVVQTNTSALADRKPCPTGPAGPWPVHTAATLTARPAPAAPTPSHRSRYVCRASWKVRNVG